MRLKKLLLFFITFTLLGCDMKVEQYKQETPELKIQEFFQGKLKVYGFLQDFKGKVTRRFTADIQGSWKGNKGLLKEKFVFNDGEISYRNWQVALNGNDISATAEDVIGTATGAQAGNAINLNYVLRIDTGGKTYDITVDDWMFLVAENRVLNVSTLKKFGITVGRLTIYIEKL